MMLTAKPDEVREILKVLDKHHISKELLETCLTLLGTTKAKELDGILNILEGEKISSDVYDRELTGIILAYETAEDFQEVFNVRVIPKNRDLHLSNARRYMRLKGMYGRFYSKEEIEDFCEIRQITVDEFIKDITLFPNKNVDVAKYHNIINQRGRLYVGGSIPIDKEYMENHGEELIKIARKAARDFGRLVGEKDLAELESRALEIIVTKGGNVVRQLEHDPEMLSAALAKKARRSLYRIIGESPIQFSRMYDNLLRVEYPMEIEEEGEEESLANRIHIEEAGFDGIEREVMRTMIELVERGEAGDLYPKISMATGIELEDVMEIVGNVKRKMLEQGIVKQTKRGDYEFGDK